MFIICQNLLIILCRHYHLHFRDEDTEAVKLENLSTSYHVNAEYLTLSDSKPKALHQGMILFPCRGNNFLMSVQRQREKDAQTFGVKEQGNCVNLGWDGFNFLSRR